MKIKKKLQNKILDLNCKMNIYYKNKKTEKVVKNLIIMYLKLGYIKKFVC